MANQPSFDEYCAEHDIQPGEEPAAFAAYLHLLSGDTWDGRIEKLGPEEPDAT